MKEKQTAPEKLIVIDIKLNRGLVVALSCVLVVAVLLTALTLAGGSASASEVEAAQPASTGIRQFYMTAGVYQGDAALSACAAGYHMASLWEIADPSQLQYNTSLGLWMSDSGQGPPANKRGWVRTGYVSNTLYEPGGSNCAVWTSSQEGHYGTQVILPTDWTSDSDDIGVWSATADNCIFSNHVWCIED